MPPTIEELSQLPIAQRLELVQQLWDSIAESKEQIPIQEWHRELVNARLGDFDGEDEEPGLSRDEVWQQVDERRGS